MNDTDDNITFDAAGRAFVSWNVTGRICALHEDGSLTELVAPGMVWPLDVVESPDGLVVSDGLKLARVAPSGAVEPIAFGSASGFPVMCRGVDLVSPGVVVLTTAAGDVSVFDVTERGFVVIDMAPGVDAALLASRTEA